MAGCKCFFMTEGSWTFETPNTPPFNPYVKVNFKAMMYGLGDGPDPDWDYYTLTLDAQEIINAISRSHGKGMVSIVNTEAPGKIFICEDGVYGHYQDRLVFTAFFRPGQAEDFKLGLVESAITALDRQTEYEGDFFADI